MAFFNKGVTLYHPGSRTSKEVVDATKEVLRDMGVEFIMLDGLESGFGAWYAGYEEVFLELKEKNLLLFKKKKIKNIITNDPHEAFTFKERYEIDAKHTLEVFNQHLETINRGEGKKATYHHACFLDKLGVKDQIPLRILSRANIHAKVLHGCCGSVGGDFSRNNPLLATKIAKQRVVESDGLLITGCPHCYAAFKPFKNVKDVAELLRETQ